MATQNAGKWGYIIGQAAATAAGARNATSGTATANPSTTANSVRYLNGAKGYNFTMSYFYIDTSSLTSVTAATLNFTIGSVGAIPADINLYLSDAFGGDGSTNLVNADFDNLNFSSGYTDSTYNVTTATSIKITLNARAISDINSNNAFIIAAVEPSDASANTTFPPQDYVTAIDWSVTPQLEYEESPPTTPTPTPSITPSITPTQTVTPTITPTPSITPSITPSSSAIVYNINTINGVLFENISKFNNTNILDLNSINGTDIVYTEQGTLTTYLSVDFSDQTYTDETTLPTGWREMTTNDTVWDSQSQTTTLAGDWQFDYNATTSSNTGPNGGLAGGVSATTGTQSSINRYLYIETSATHTGPPYSMSVITLPILDFSNSLSNNTLKLTFWFHMFGTNNNNTQYFGVAATTSQTDASSTNEVVTGSGFSSENGGGLDITYWTADDGSTTTTSNRISGQQQTSASALWRKAEVDLNSLAGESTVYLHFMISNVRYFTCDFAVDGVLIEGEE
jgi:hypothetical protein